MKIKYPSICSSDPKEKSLAYFVFDMRRLYHQNKLHKIEIRFFERLPGWSWDKSNPTRNDFCTKEEFIQWCKNKNIKHRRQFYDWNRENKRPKYIPSSPEQIYDFSWSEISGKVNYLYRTFISETEFIEWCENKNITNFLEFRQWCNENKKPDNIHINPNRYYKEFSWGKIKGNKLNFISKEEYIQWCIDNKINSNNYKKWFTNNGRPNNIPYDPRYYENWTWKLVTRKGVKINE